MQPDRAPKMKYGSAAKNRLTMELDAAAVANLLTIQDLLRRGSDAPTVPVSRSTAARRAFAVYAESLSRQDVGTIRHECARATDSTYISKRK